MVWMALYFWLITKEWIYYQMVGLSLNVLTVICLLFIPESPKFLYEKKRFDEVRQVFQKIANINGLKINFNFKFDYELEIEN